MTPLTQGYSGIAPQTSWIAFGPNQGTNEGDTRSDPHSAASIIRSQTSQKPGPEVGHDIVIGFHEEVIYCSPNTYSGKQKMNRSTSQPHFRSQNTPATIEADQISLAFQQLANNNKSANFHNNINRISICQNRSPKRCKRLTENLRSSSGLKVFSIRASKFTIT